GAGPFRKELPVREEGGVTRTTLPELGVWSMVALDCRGPASDTAPPALFPLPPPPVSRAEPLAEATGASALHVDLVYAADNAGWWRPDPAPRGKRLPLQRVAAPAASAGQAVRCAGDWHLEAYRPGELIQGGVYRFSFRVKSEVPPPAKA